MGFTDTTLFHIIKSRLDYTSQRQDVLSRSIANLDTPHFQAQDLKQQKNIDRVASEFGRKLQALITNEKHISGSSNSDEKFRSIKSKITYETKPVGNNVTSDEIMMRMNENSMDYHVALNLYNKASTLYKVALGSRG